MFSLIAILVSGIFVGAVAGYLGSLMLSRKMTIVVDPLSHLALPGVALALIFQKDVSLGAFFFLFLGTIFIWFLEQKTKLPTETVIAIVFSVALAITFLFLNEEELHTALMGDISKVDFNQAIFIVLACVLIFVLVRMIYQKVLLISLSEDLARVEKINVKKYQFLYLLSVSVIVSLGVKFVGGLLVAGLTVLPSSASRIISKNLKSYQFFSVFVGVICAIFGTLIFKMTHLTLGPVIIISNFFVFCLCLFLKRVK